MTTYLAIDPGLTTGWAVYNDHLKHFDSGECRGRDTFYRWMGRWGMALDYDVNGWPDHVVIERWDVRKDTFGKSAQEDARYIIGAVEWWTWQRDDITYAEQRPAEAKKFSTNDKLRKLGWYTGGEGHGDDAARHLLVYLAKLRVPEIIEALT